MQSNESIREKALWCGALFGTMTIIYGLLGTHYWIAVMGSVLFAASLIFLSRETGV